MTGVVYSESVVWSPPTELASIAPYQLVLVDLEDGTRVTGRMAAQDRVHIGDRVIVASGENGLKIFALKPANE
jgi:uncharacterized OB-fold protein